MQPSPLWKPSHPPNGNAVPIKQQLSNLWNMVTSSHFHFYELLILYISCKRNDLTFFLLCPIYILNFFMVNPGGSMNPNYILKYGWIIFHGVCISLFVYLLGTLGLFPTFFVVVQLLSRVQLFVIRGLQYARLPCPHCLLECTHIHVHWAGDAIWPSHPLLPSFPVAVNLSKHQVLF